MRRLNVRQTQIEECIRTSLFAVEALPRNPSLQRGELLLLQLVKSDADRLGKAHSRIEFALVFDHVEEDITGEISRLHWPDAGKSWRWILVCSETLPTLPFSLELLSLSKDYGGQANPYYISRGDEAAILPYVTSAVGEPRAADLVGVRGLLGAIRNHDVVVHLAPPRRVMVSEHERRVGDSWLSDALKALYYHKCQICAHDFVPRYGVPYADTHVVAGASTPTRHTSKDILVVCPNHDAILGAAGAKFDTRNLAFMYPNGLVERLLLRDHLL